MAMGPWQVDDGMRWTVRLTRSGPNEYAAGHPIRGPFTPFHSVTVYLYIISIKNEFSLITKALFGTSLPTAS